MSAAKHTPGPWFVGPIHNGRGVPVQRGTEGGFLVYGTSPDRERADAALCAAAPDLLEALVDLCDSQLTSRDREGAISRGLAAIAKARGEA